jgi:hypothetical protein
VSNVVVALCMPNVPAPAPPPGGPGAVGISKVFLDGRKEGAVCAGAGVGFVRGGSTGVGVCRGGARCEGGAGVGLGLGEGEGVVAGAGAGMWAGEGRGCDWTRVGKGGNVESGTDMLGACGTMGYEDAGKCAAAVEAAVGAAGGTGEVGGGGANGEGG